MSLAEQAELVARLWLDDELSPAVKKPMSSMAKLNAQTKQLQQGLGKIGQGLKTGFKRAAIIGAGGIALLTAGIKAGIDSLAELEDLQRATQTVLKSTRRVSGMTAKAIRSLAEEYEDLTTIDDKVIQGAENTLLTFTNLRKQAFEPALRAALDLSTALGMDLDSAARQVGKALQDPITGLSRLSRMGVIFTEQEQKKVKALVASGHQLEAQRLILQKLNRMYGGQAQAAAKGYRGQLNRLKDAGEELSMALAKPLLRPLTRLTVQLTKFAKSKDVQEGLRGIGQTVADFFSDENIATGIDTVKKAFTTLRDDIPWDVIKQQAAFAATIARQALGIFNGLPPEVKGALITMLAANKLTGGLVASGLKDIATFTLRSLTTINAAHVTVTGPVSGGGPGGGTGGGGGNSGGVVTPMIGAAAVIDVGYIREKLTGVNDKMQRLIDQDDADNRETRTLTARGNEIALRNKPILDKIAAQAINYAIYQKQMDEKQNAHDERELSTTKVGFAQAVRTALEQTRVQRLGVNAVQTQGTLTRERNMRDAAAIRGAIDRKDLSVTVRTSFNVSGREVADAVTRTVARNRFVTD